MNKVHIEPKDHFKSKKMKRTLHALVAKAIKTRETGEHTNVI